MLPANLTGIYWHLGLEVIFPLLPTQKPKSFSPEVPPPQQIGRLHVGTTSDARSVKEKGNQAMTKRDFPVLPGCGRMTK